jgi:hypothetical protein
MYHHIRDRQKDGASIFLGFAINTDDNVTYRPPRPPSPLVRQDTRADWAVIYVLALYLNAVNAAAPKIIISYGRNPKFETLNPLGIKK